MNATQTSSHRIGPVDLDKDVFIIAEIGNNHEGDVSLAAKLIGFAPASMTCRHVRSKDGPPPDAMARNVAPGSA